MSMRNIFAHTALEHPYPQYVSINVRDDGDVEVSVRSPANPDGTSGAQAHATLSREQVLDCAQALLRSLTWRT